MTKNAATLVSVVSNGATMLTNARGQCLGCIVGHPKSRTVFAHGSSVSLDLTGVPPVQHARLAREFVAANAVMPA